MKLHSYPLLVFALLLSQFTVIKAEIITDGTVGPTVNVNGPNFIIGQELGSQIGNNLFHSFKTFDINTNNGISESATFTGSADINNVISRVTGGEISTINGLLKSEISNADFYFINPAGIIFGENAKVDVPAAFHISTADELKFADGSTFSATEPNKSALGIAQPEAFGFLQPQDTSLIVNGSQLEFKPNSTVSLTSSNIGLNNTGISSESGTITIIANGNNSTPVSITGSLPQQSNGDFIANSSFVNVSGDGAGQLNVAAGKAFMNEGILLNSNIGSTNALGHTKVQASQLQLHNGSQISSGTFAQGHGVAISVETDQLLISGVKDKLTGIGSNALVGSTGHAGDVIVKVNGLLEVNNGGEIFGSTFSSGNAGNLIVDAKHLSMNANAGLLSQIASNTFSSGNAGNIDLNVKGLLEVYQYSEISNSTGSTGNSGILTINAGGVLIDSLNSGYSTGIYSSAIAESSGLVGNINIQTQELLLKNNSSILAAHRGEIDEQLLTSFQPSILSIKANHLDLQSGSIISTSSEKNVPASYIDLQISNSLSLSDISIISSSANTGDAGLININSQGTTNLKDSFISSETFGSGHSGNILLFSKEQLNQNNSTISSSTYAQGNAGEVNIYAKNIDLKQASAIVSNASAEASGKVGNINIQANTIKLLQSGVYAVHLGNTDANSLGVDDKGKIFIQADNIDMQQESRISASSFGNVNASDIDLLVNNHLLIANSSEITSTGRDGDAGFLRVVVLQQLDLENGSHIGSDTIGKGKGGNIILLVDGQINLDNASLISSNTLAQGNAGIVSIAANSISINNNSAILSAGGDETATGLAGDINIYSKDILLANNSFISIDHLGEINEINFINFSPGSLYIEADNLTLNNLSAISASASGSFPASAIELNIDSRLQLKNSLISSFANTNHGGNITIKGNAGFIMKDSLITTSTNGGNGGDIDINSAALVMDTGFIQANTAVGAMGGNISINVPFLLTRNAILPEIGGITAQKFSKGSGQNIIQAAAPEGNPGSLSISSPEVDISASLITLSSKFLDKSSIAEDPCATIQKKKSSSLVSAGRGGTPSNFAAPSSISYGGNRLEQLHNKTKFPTSMNNKPEKITLDLIPTAKSESNQLNCITM